MTSSTRSLVRVAVASLALAAAPARAQVPGPDRIEVLQAEDGPRVLLAGVGPGTAYARAAERLGGRGTVGDFFGGGPIVKTGELDGATCSLMVFDEEDRVRDLAMFCEGSRAALRRLADRFRAAVAGLPATEHEGVTYYGERAVASIAVVPAHDGSWWDRTFGPRELRFAIRR